MARSQHLFEQAQRFIPGGVNSPVRAFRGVGGTPVFIASGQGAYVTDVDGKKYIDYVCSWGPLILGHAHPQVVAAVQAAAAKGFSFGASTEIEITLAEKICQIMPSIELVRFVSSGTEAAMSAIRVARGFTKRNKIIKFSSCYHGHTDSLLVAAGSGGLTFGIPNSAGVPESIVAHTLVADFNNLESVAALFAKYSDDIAGIIVEPVTGNMNCVLPKPGFLAGLRQLCDQYGSLLIFDEVITGFRISLGGAQAHFGVRPDITVLGKIIGGGFPVGAFGGRKDIMQCVAPLGPVYQAGTLSGNPVAMAAGLATINLLTEPNFYPAIAAKTEQLTNGLKKIAQQHNVPFVVNHIASMFGLYFTQLPAVTTEAEVLQSDVPTFKKFFHAMLKEGCYFAPSAFEVGFVSAAHGEKEINDTLQTAEKVFVQLNKN